MSYKNFFYFDIETASEYPTFSDFIKNDERGANLFSKKCENFRKYESGWEKPVDETYLEKASLYPEFSKIICLSWGMFTNEGEMKIGSIIDDDEIALLKRITKVFTRASDLRRTYCGFNVKQFDIPFIVKRIYKHNIELPISLNFLDLKPWELNVKDLYEVWKGTGKTSANLEEVCYCLNINSPKIIMSGENVHDYYWNRNDIKSISSYCEDDVVSIIEICKKLKL